MAKPPTGKTCVHADKIVALPFTRLRTLRLNTPVLTATLLARLIGGAPHLHSLSLNDVPLQIMQLAPALLRPLVKFHGNALTISKAEAEFLVNLPSCL